MTAGFHYSNVIGRKDVSYVKYRIHEKKIACLCIIYYNGV
ncbi:hypothetical protein CLOSTHATH_05656 [Hungatella hathewayi DSM 13479]|uniref:Uncharacterized protein n=1 Tax=Hungatella hathewayi DSM 13479 TaxID=566550 RepID=D3APV2_9FIRM|nr:hypothetical protein CLOSTHATH_05656 [Hungatella hathewayi DSM 13479]